MAYTPEKGDIVWLNFSPQSGHEQMGRRPAIIVSNTLFNKKTGLSMVCPITSTNRQFPLHIEIKELTRIKGFVMIEQIKSVDFKSRNIEFIEKSNVELLNDVLSMLHACMY